MRSWLLGLVFLSIFGSLSSPAIAWDGEKLMTVGGLLRIDEVDRADVIHLGDRPIPLDGLRAHLVSQLPKEGPAEFAIYYVWSGCANCGVEYFLLDAGAKSPQPLYIARSPYGEGDEPEIISYKPGTISLRRFDGDTTVLGDAIIDVLQYKRGDKDFSVIRHSAVDDYKKFVGKEVTHLLSDAEARYSLVELMGMKAFGKFRDCLHGDPKEDMTLEDNRYLVGYGEGNRCESGWAYAIVVIDTYFDRAWAIKYDAEYGNKKASTYKAWGTLGKGDDTVRQMIDAWLFGFGRRLMPQDGPIEVGDIPQPFPTSSPPAKN